MLAARVGCLKSHLHSRQSETCRRGSRAAGSTARRGGAHGGGTFKSQANRYCVIAKRPSAQRRLARGWVASCRARVRRSTGGTPELDICCPFPQEEHPACSTLACRNADVEQVEIGAWGARDAPSSRRSALRRWRRKRAFAEQAARASVMQVLIPGTAAGYDVFQCYTVVVEAHRFSGFLRR